MLLAISAHQRVGLPEGMRNLDGCGVQGCSDAGAGLGLCDPVGVLLGGSDEAAGDVIHQHEVTDAVRVVEGHGSAGAELPDDVGDEPPGGLPWTVGVVDCEDGGGERGHDGCLPQPSRPCVLGTAVLRLVGVIDPLALGAARRMYQMRGFERSRARSTRGRSAPSGTPAAAGKKKWRKTLLMLVSMKTEGLL